MSTKSLTPLIETYHNEQHEKSCEMPIYNAYSDNDYDDDNYYIPTIAKSHPSPMLVLKWDESSIDIYGNPYDSNFEKNVDKFCEQYLNDKSASLEEEKTFFRVEIKHQYHKSFSSKNLHAENKDYTLEKDHVNVEPFSCDGSLPSSTSSNIHASPKTFEPSKYFRNLSSNKSLGAFYVVPYSYPQGLPLKET